MPSEKQKITTEEYHQITKSTLPTSDTMKRLNDLRKMLEVRHQDMT